MNIFGYDTHKFPFKELIKNTFQEDDLEKIHEKYVYPTGRCTNLDNSNSVYHNRFYDKLRGGQHKFNDAYDRFITEVVSDIFKEEFIYQTVPTLRIHLVDNWATPEFHYDSQEGYNHPPGEINFIVPLTKCYGTNSLWVESSPGGGDFKPIVMNYGNLFMGNLNECLHGNKINRTSITRVTFDFRILPLSKYTPQKYTQSATRGIKFEIGSYYKLPSL